MVVSLSWVQGHDGTVRCATFNADSTMIVSGAASGEVMLFGVQGASPPGRLGVTERPQPVNALELSPFEDNLLATVYDHGALRLWDTEAMALRTQFESAHQAAATAVGFSSFNHLLLCTAGLDGFLVFYDIEANRCVTRSTNHAILSSAFCLALPCHPPTHNWMRVAIVRSMLACLHLRPIRHESPYAYSHTACGGNTHRIVKEIECPEPLTSMAFMHDGATVAAGTSSGNACHVLRGLHQSVVMSLSWRHADIACVSCPFQQVKSSSTISVGALPLRQRPMRLLDLCMTLPSGQWSPRGQHVNLSRRLHRHLPPAQYVLVARFVLAMVHHQCHKNHHSMFVHMCC